GDRLEAENLLAAPHLDRARAERLAELIAPALGETVAPGDLLAAALAIPEGDAGGAYGSEGEVEDVEDGEALPGFVGGPTSPSAPSLTRRPSAAGWRLEPRRLIRIFSVWRMKDRAGKVGVHGVAPLLAELLAAGDARLHLLGHSFGARVMLTALACEGMARSRPVRSLLLLQPAVNGWCFAADVDGRGTPGGFRPVLRPDSGSPRVELPMVSTFSEHDVPLCRVFPLALRRGRDLGEARLASSGEGEKEAGRRPAHRWASLGGVGPLGADRHVLRVPMPGPGEPYPLDRARDGGFGILAVDGRDRISDHGDVANPATAWALQSLVAAE
ncbi:MAG: hypothetical protein MI919_27515, partial [Holophagales bacterium]|nr:hypothetical protein [Holophagales bacterium]